ncbi:4-hydroxyphenylacetate 3-hydroxylase N-terminal domain-containing protein [Peribacillus frigoritolerans]|nr:4-hydroxyphenylacetate 3-hydroxylase N-terminal domain-containing protein [Peribacillus frigoritolerans]
MMNGKEYLESLRDGRTVFLNSDKVDDVTTHPAYPNSARSIAQLYDALHDPDTARILTAKTDGGHTPISSSRPQRTQQSCLKQGMP